MVEGITLPENGVVDINYYIDEYERQNELKNFQYEHLKRMGWRAVYNLPQYANGHMPVRSGMTPPLNSLL